jgi:hypothetical protein
VTGVRVVILALAVSGPCQTGIDSRNILLLALNYSSRGPCQAWQIVASSKYKGERKIKAEA